MRRGRLFWLLTILVGYGGWVFAQLIILDGTPRWYLWLGQLFKVYLIATALWLTWRGRDGDLMEQRLQFRNYFCGVVGVVAGTIVVVEGVSGFTVPELIELAGMLVICVLALLANFRFQSFGRILSATQPPIVPIEIVANPLITRLTELMEDQRIYSDCDLKIGGLAQQVGLPEHQVRKAINGSMGYQNFNQYVNEYRIREASIRLREDLRMPILSIALDVGFRSISAFNAVFRLAHQCTPTEYRELGQQNLPDS